MVNIICQQKLNPSKISSYNTVLTYKYIDENECYQNVVGEEYKQGYYGTPTVSTFIRAVRWLNLYKTFKLLCG